MNVAPLTTVSNPVLSPRPAWKAATLDVPFWFDATVSPRSERIGEAFAHESVARTAAAAYAVQNKASVLLYGHGNQFELYEAEAKPGGIGNAAVVAQRFEIGRKIANDTEATGIRFFDATIKALIGANRVIENTSGNAHVKF